MNGDDILKDYWRMKAGKIDRESMRDLTAMNQATVVSDGTRLQLELQEMARRGKIVEAQEKLLAQVREQPSVESEDVVNAFYDDLAELTDQQLASCGVTREMLEQGKAQAMIACNGLSAFRFD